MFHTNPIGQLFGKPEGEEKKKKRNKKSKKASQEASEEASSSITNSTTSLNTNEVASKDASPVGAAPEGSLIDIVNEINNNAAVSEAIISSVTEAPAVEQVETQYEEKPVEDATMQAIYQSIQNAQKDEPVEENSAWEAMLSGPAEQEWENQVDAAPQAVDSVWESMLASPPPAAEPEIDIQKQNCIDQYKITEASYDLVKAFYEEQKDEPNFGLLKNDLLKYLLKNALSERPELEGASEEDVDRALKVIDSDNDEKINFEEFVKLLSLFFSSKDNLQKRITGVLNSQSFTHKIPGSLTPIEAHEFTTYLNNFYGKQGEEAGENKNNPKFFRKLVNKISRKISRRPEESSIEENIDYNTFVTEVFMDLHELCFVKLS